MHTSFLQGNDLSCPWRASSETYPNPSPGRTLTFCRVTSTSSCPRIVYCSASRHTSQEALTQISNDDPIVLARRGFALKREFGRHLCGWLHHCRYPPSPAHHLRNHSDHSYQGLRAAFVWHEVMRMVSAIALLVRLARCGKFRGARPRRLPQVRRAWPLP